jgi:ubiquitin-activating enzyme E1
VTLFDPEITTIEDTGYNVSVARSPAIELTNAPRPAPPYMTATYLHSALQYYLTPSSVGKPRAASCVEALKELNGYVNVSVLAGASVTPDVIRKFSCVVVTSSSRSSAIEWNDACRAASPAIPFIYADIFGAAGYAFSDFGPAHTVRDKDGEALRSAVVTGVTTTADVGRLVVCTHDAKRHGFDSGDHVVFLEVEGSMSALNDGKPRRVGACTPYSFDLLLDAEDVAALPSWGDYTSGGIASQTKVAEAIAFAPLRESQDAPIAKGEFSLITPDLGKFGRPEQLHIAFAAVEAYRTAHGGALPPLRDASAAAECVELARAFATRSSSSGTPGALSLPADQVEAAVVTRVAALARTELSALSAFFGGVVAQEVVKVTGKFSPLRQWLYLDAFELFPPGADPACAAADALPAENFTPAGSRYDGIAGIIGHAAQARVMDQKVFVVGSGALGCEMLKSFVLMGVGCGPQGRVTITDMDRIEVSNLNRQFLFRSQHVGKPKSVTAAAVARSMNPSMKIEALEIPVGDDTEETFDDAFWSGLDVITNALDNVKARQYVDGRAVWFEKPLLESGTLGTKANTQVVLPHKTETYSDSVDPPEESIPMCTLKNFPNLIEHCIEWARDVFQGSFCNAVQDAKAFLAAPARWLEKAAEEPNVSSRLKKIKGVADVLSSAETASLQTCATIARTLFNDNFVVNIHQLLHNFPANYVDKDGNKFWSGPKRAPRVVDFDAADPVHFEFALHATALVAYNLGLSLPAGWDDAAAFSALLMSISVPSFVPKNVVIKAGDNDTAVEGGADDAVECSALATSLEAKAKSGIGAGGAGGGRAFVLAPAEFEKDDDTNHHIDFITAASNLRARNYTIREATRHSVKMVAGKIIPAIATTTCSIAGLVCLEFYKVVSGAGLAAARNSFMNLGVNVYSMCEPVEPKKTKDVAYDPISMGPVRAYPPGFTRWDKFVVREGNLTVGAFKAFLKEKHGLTLSMIVVGKIMAFAPDYFPSHKEREKLVLKDLVAKILSERDPPEAIPAKRDYITLNLTVTDDDGDIVLPTVQYYFR